MAEDLALDTRKEVSATPAKDLRRWLLEIKLAQKREKDWRKTARGVLDVYRGKNRKKNSFNILWANTEHLRPALYNSTPKPDVRRRFRQNDMLGKAVSEVMERSTSYCVDAYDLDNCLQNAVLDALLPGRAVDRVRYVPKFKEVADVAKPTDAAGTESGARSRINNGIYQGKNPSPDAEKDEAFEGNREEVEYEQALCDHVQWDDFLHGPGKTWEEVQWVAFRARLTKDDLIEKFGDEIAKQITLNDTGDEDIESKQNSDVKEVFKRAECWEIWDKEGEKVFFVNDSYKKGVIYPKGEQGEPPLKLKNFFPCPRPLQLVEDTGTLVPSPLYELYREQAEELDRLSARINKIVNACRVRFVHDPTLTELKQLMDAGDNEGIPAEQARAWMTNGGIEKAIWWMPIDKVAAVLRELYVARDAAKQVIYEITGISDILRGATDPNETLGAQKLKANSSSLRLQRMQREVQRYTRDLIRLLAEVIGENFDPQTLSQMTGLQFPTNVQKQAIQLQMQVMQQQGQESPQLQAMQNALKMPSWEDIMAVLRSDMQREYRVDVETDSTVAQSLQQDMEGLREVYTALVELWTGAGPAVAAGAVKIDVIKAMSMNIVRRARMGLEVEDALESGMQEPKPQDNGEAAKAQAEQAKQQAEVAKEQEKTKQEGQTHQAEAQRKQVEEQASLQREALASQEKVQLDAQAKAAEVEKHKAELAQKDAFERWKVEQDNNTKIRVAEISAEASRDVADAKAEQADNETLNDDGSKAQAAGEKSKKRAKPIDKLAEMHAQSMEMHGKTVQAIAGLAELQARPKRIIRGPDGRAAGVETVNH